MESQRRKSSAVLFEDGYDTPVIYESNRQPNPNFSLLLEAIKNGDINMVRSCLNSGIPADYREPAMRHRGPLHYATKYNFNEAIVELIERNGNPLSADLCGITPLHTAASNGFISPLRHLLAASSTPDPFDKHKRTPLHYASRASSHQSKNNSLMLEVIAALLAAGASYGSRDIEGRIPLHMAAAVGNSRIVRLLALGRGITHISSADKDGCTPLHYAVQGARCLDTVSTLLEFGARIDARDKNGTTPLHIVSSRSINYVDEDFDAACLQLLLANGASVTASDDNGQNALSLSLMRTMWWNRRSPKDSVLHVVKLLISKGSPITDTFTMWRIIETFPSLVAVALNQSFRVNTSACDSLLFRLDFDIRPLTQNSRLLEEQHKLDQHQQKNLKGPINTNIIPDPLTVNSEISILRYILWAGHKSILQHPLIKAFLHLKWLKMRNLFIVNLIFFFAFVMTTTIFILSTKDCITNNTSFDNFIKSDTKAEKTSVEINCLFIWWVLLAFHLLHSIRELVQIIHTPMMYIYRFENLLDIILIISIPLILIKSCDCIENWQKPIAAITILTAWSRLMFLLGQFPSCGVYIVMFSTVAKNVIKFLGLYLSLLIAFALGFHVLMRSSQDSFKSPLTALISSVVSKI